MAFENFVYTAGAGGGGSSGTDLDSVLTSTGDMVYRDAVLGVTRLALGANNYVIKSNGTTAIWGVDPVQDKAVAKGDTLAATGADALTVVTVGANDTIYTADSSVSNGVAWKSTATLGIAMLAAPTFTGDAKAVTATAGDNDTSIATTAFSQQAAIDKMWMTPQNCAILSQGSAATTKLKGASHDGKDISNTNGLTTQRATWFPITLPRGTITGIVFCTGTAANYTATNENSLSLYTSDGTTLTRVAVSANDSNIYKTSSQTRGTAIAFQSPYTSAGGTFWVCILASWSAAVQAPFAWYGAVTTQANFGLVGVSDNNYLSYKDSQTTSPTSQTWAGMTGTDTAKRYMVGAY